MKRINSIVGLIALLALCIPSVQASTRQVEPEKAGRSLAREGSLAPNFTLTDTKGNSVSLEDLRGKVVLLNFWATWCPYCVEDMPVMEELHSEFKGEDVVILSINVEDQETASAFMRENGYTFKALVDSEQEVAALYEVEALPTMFVIGTDGTLLKTFVGVTEKSTLSQAIAKAGKSKSSDA